MKTWKRALALVLALVMALSLVALPSFAEGEETGGGTAATQPVWPAEGSINLSKKAQPVEGQDGLYELTLTIQGKNYSTTSDVVLVIDNSNSMYYANGVDDDDGYGTATTAPRMKNTIAAAKAFADKLLTENSTTHIALVVYGTNVHWSTDFYDAAHKSNLTQKLGEISRNNNKGGTNQQAGIHKAQELLASASSTGKLKNIVILSDGEATYSHRITGRVTCTNDIYIGSNLIGTKYYATSDIDWATAQIQCDYSSNRIDGSGRNFYFEGNRNLTISGCRKNGGDSYITHGIPTIWEANQAKTAGTTIFSVALQAGTNGENTLKSCATDPAKGYFAIANNDNVETKLTAAFTTIAGSIAIAASNGTVTDPMSQFVSLNFDGTPKVTNSLDGYNAGGYDVYLSQGTVTRNEQTLSWDVGNINEGTPAVMKYRVRLNDNVESAGETYPTNDTTTFNYTDYQGRETSKDFDIPQVAPNAGTILMHFYLVNAQGQPINEKGVVVESPDKAKQLASQEYYQESGSPALNYNTYNVPMKEIPDAAYYGYTLDGFTTKDVTAAPVTVSATNANREVWFAYYQTFNVVHVRMDKSGNAQQVGEIDTYPVSASFNLTEKVNKKADGSAVTAGDYLYGGAFSDKDCTKAYSFADGETGLSFVPQAGETYYIWEVPAAYLNPKTVFGREHNEAGQWDVNAFYMAFGIDRGYYKQVGFVKNDKDVVANQTPLQHDDGKTELKRLDGGKSVAFEKISLIRKDGGSTTYQLGDIVKGYSNGYIVCYGLPQSKWQNTSVSTVYTPYWVTLDGVKVYSNLTRTATYKGAGNPRMDTPDAASNKSCEPFQTSAQTQLLLMATYCADSAAIAPDTPAVENVTVTVVDGDKTAQYQVPAGAGVRDQVAYQAPAGKVFAGWFADQACTTPADLDQVTQDTTIYAKYVSDSYLDLDYSRIGLFRLRGVTLISAVDNPANYQASGFIVGDQKLDASYASRYLIFKTPASLFGAARDAKLMLADKSLSGTGDLEVTPYWVTLDGTEVHGVTHTLHYNTRTIWE